MDLIFAGWPGITILLVYGAIILGTGLYFYFKAKSKKIGDSSDEYFLGGRGLGPIVLFFTFLAAQYSGNTIVGFAPKAYRLGFGWIQSICFMILAVAGLLMFSPRLYPLSKKFKFITPTDWLQHRFKSKSVSICATILMAYALANFILAMFVAIGQAVEGLTGDTVPYQAGVVFFVVIMLTYSSLGGMHSVAYVHFIQGITLTLGIVMLLVGAFVAFGDLGSATAYMATHHVDKIQVPTNDVIAKWISILILFGLGPPLYPHAIQRVFAAESIKTLKKSMSNMLYVPFVLAGSIMVVGLIGVKAFPGLERIESEKLVGYLANGIAEVNPFFYVAMIIFFGGIVAAITSTADSAILSLSSLMSKDIYGRYIKPKAKEKEKINFGKIATIIISIILLIIAWNPPETLYQILVIKFELLIQILPAFAISMYWRRMSKWPTLIGMLSGVGSTLYMITMMEGMRSPMGFYAGIWGLGINLAIVIVGSLLWPHKTKK